MISFGRKSCGFKHCSGTIHVSGWSYGMECGWKNTSPRRWFSLKRRDFKHGDGFAYGMVMFFNCRKGKELYGDQVPAGTQVG